MSRSLLSAVVTAALLYSHPATADTCSALTSLTVANARVTSAASVAAGAFVPPSLPRPGGTGQTAAAVPAAVASSRYATLPAFCRVAATLTPTADSDIKIEVWLPEPSKWNGKFEAVGNGGWAGTIVYTALADALAAGYATANTDTGHVGGTASFAPGHPEKVIDMAYRAVHEMTVQAKAIINAYYRSAPSLSFWNGCSLGGRQGITEALRYPADFDAIIAGAPAVNWMDLHVGRVALNRDANRSPDAAIPPSKYPLLHDAALAACDGRDGVKDGVIDNPMACRFDAATLACTAGQDPASCLTPLQIASANALYTPVKNPVTGATIMPGLEPGSELNFGVIGGREPVATAVEADKYIIHQDPGWDFRRGSLASDLEAARRADPDDALGSSSTNLTAFFARGGKLLMYHGFQDPQVPPQNSINYYTTVVNGPGKGLAGSQIALYMVPGMNHCSGGPGTDVFDKMAALESWMRTGKAPESIPAAHRTNGVVDRTRPLCRFPQVARWRGIGSTDDAANFSCVVDTAPRPRR